MGLNALIFSQGGTIHVCGLPHYSFLFNFLFSPIVPLAKTSGQCTYRSLVLQSHQIFYSINFEFRLIKNSGNGETE